MKKWFLLTSFLIGLLISCGGDGSNNSNTDFVFGDLDDTQTFSEPWPTDMSTILTTEFDDPENDQEQMPVEQAGPPYSQIMIFPSIDLKKISLGTDDKFLYMRVDFTGVIPKEKVHIEADGEIEEQFVTNQGMNISLNVDNDESTGSNGEGVHGVEIFFAIGFDFGIKNAIYANYDFSDGDIHNNQQQALGEIGEGGQGFNYILVRFDVSSIEESFFPRNKTIELGSWSEAESYDENNNLKYHHFAFDGFTKVNWDVK